MESNRCEIYFHCEIAINKMLKLKPFHLPLNVEHAYVHKNKASGPKCEGNGIASHGPMPSNELVRICGNISFFALLFI